MPRRLVLLAVVAGLLYSAVSAAAPQGVAFTYQGRLDSGGVPQTGAFDVRFRLHDAPAAGAQVGADLTLTAVPVVAGLFSADLDFGTSAFTGQARWLEVAVKGAGDADFVTLTPRQPITSVPYATYALSGGGGGGSSQWVNGTHGVHYLVGNVGVGASAADNIRLYSEGGVDRNAGYFANNSATFAALVLRNFGTNGWGLYDDTSDRHYLNGRVGVLAQPSPLAMNVGGAGRFSYAGNTSDGEGYSSALWAHGYTGTGAGGRVCNGLTAGSTDGRGVYGISQNNWGVTGENLSAGTYGILGTPSEGLYAQTSSTTLPAARFNVPAGGVAIEANGLVKVKTLQILGGADLAERFECPGGAEPGTVMAIDPSSPGHVRIASEAYCPTVAGVVSGANRLDAGIELGTGEPGEGTVALALTGRVWVKCDATASPIRPGDLLTTAAMPGHAMRAADRARAAGAVLGKAMTSLEDGTGLVLVLVSLQ